jgi:hypothetical protein
MLFAQVRVQPSALDSLALALAERHTEIIRRQVARLDAAYRVIAAASSMSSQEEQEASIRAHLLVYFQQARPAAHTAMYMFPVDLPG